MGLTLDELELLLRATKFACNEPRCPYCKEPRAARELIQRELKFKKVDMVTGKEIKNANKS